MNMLFINLAWRATKASRALQKKFSANPLTSILSQGRGGRKQSIYPPLLWGEERPREPILMGAALQDHLRYFLKYPNGASVRGGVGGEGIN
jgi:hypothetical protein